MLETARDEEDRTRQRDRNNLSQRVADHNPMIGVLDKLDERDDLATNLHVANLDDMFVRVRGSVEIAEDMVEVNKMVIEGMDPLGVGAQRHFYS